MLRTILTMLLLAGLVLSGTSVAFAQYPDQGSPLTNIVAQSMATSGAASDGTVTYYANDGSVSGTDLNAADINPKAVKEIQTKDAPVASNFNGAAILSSDQQVGAVVSVQNRNVSGATDGRTQGAYNATTVPDTKLFFPTVFRFQFIVSRLTIQNAESTTNNIKLTFTKRDGSAAGELTAQLAGFGSRTFYLGNTADVPSNFPADFEDGAVIVESTDNKKLAGAAVITWGNRSGAYQALTTANQGKELYAPTHFRFINNAPSNWASLSGGQWTLFSAINCLNTNATTVANVTASYTGRGSSTESLSKTFTIQPNSAAGLNTQNGGDFPAADFNNLSKAGSGLPDWDGSVKITSDQDLVCVNITNWGSGNRAGISALVGPGEGAEELFLPAQYRLHYASDGQWSQWSAINLMNIGTAAINSSDITVEYIDQAGATIKSFTGGSLPASTLPVGGAFGLNTRNGGDLDATAFNDFPVDGSRPSFIGGIYVKGPAGSKLIAAGNIIYFNRASVYNAFPKTQ